MEVLFVGKKEVSMEGADFPTLFKNNQKSNLKTMFLQLKKGAKSKLKKNRNNYVNEVACLFLNTEVLSSLWLILTICLNSLRTIPKTQEPFN